jgi:threonine/homoserine/homoserine lactone efflux protein
LSALVRASTTVFSVLKIAGAAYLVFLGAQALWRSRRPSEDNLLSGSAAPAGSPFRQGLISNVLNPKLAVFFVTVLPQFIDADAVAARPLLLAAVYAGLCAVWLGGLTLAMSRLREALRSPRVVQMVERVTGAVLVAVGLRLAFERR